MVQVTHQRITVLKLLKATKNLHTANMYGRYLSIWNQEKQLNEDVH